MAFLSALRLVAAALCALSVSAAVHAQARATDDPSAARSPFAATFERFDEVLARRVIGADDAASRWLSGRLSSLEPAAQARDYAAAVAREPLELLFVASLADACMSAALPPCNERDIVGYWASRDADNAVPWLLQAERARRRNNLPSLVENLDRGSRSSRYDNYESRAGAVLWNKLAPLVEPSERAAGTHFAAVPSSGGAHLRALESVCSPLSRGQDERIAASCGRLGNLMAERAPSLSDRRAGTQIALAAATSDAARATAGDLARTVIARQQRCRESLSTLERFAVGAPAQRERALTLGESWLAAREREGEPAACDALSRALTSR